MIKPTSRSVSAKRLHTSTLTILQPKGPIALPIDENNMIVFFLGKLHISLLYLLFPFDCNFSK